MLLLLLPRLMTMVAKLTDVTPACFGMAHGYQDAALASAVAPEVDQQQTSLGHFLRIPMQCRMGRQHGE